MATTGLSALVGVLAFAGAAAQAGRVNEPDEPVAALIRAVEGKDPDALYTAAAAVGTAGKAEDAVDRLASFLDTCDDPAVGSLARLALTAVSLYAPGLSTRATAAVGAAGDDSSRARAAMIAGSLGADVRALAPALRAGLRDKNAVIRNGCLDLLAPLGRDDPGIIEDVAAALDDGSPEVRAAAAEALASLGQAARKALDGLRKRLDDGDERVRVPAAAAVLGLDPGARGRALEILTAGLTSGESGVPLRAAGTLAVAGPDEAAMAVGPLRQLLRSRRRTERVRSALVLSGIASPQAAAALPALIEGMSAQDPVLRMESAQAFGRLGVRTPEAVEALAKALIDPIILVRIEAAISLVVLGAKDTPGVSDPLVAAIGAAIPARDRAISALGTLGEADRPAIGALVELLGHPNALVREGAARALTAIGPTASNAAGRLADLLGDDDERVRAAAYGLRWLSPGDDVRPRLTVLVEDPRPEVRERAVTLLAYVGTEGAVGELVRACKADPTRFEAIVEEGPRLAFQFRRTEAERLASVMVRVAEGMGGQDPKLLTSALEKQAYVLTTLGRHDQAIAAYRRVRARDEDAKQWDQAALAGVALGDAYRNDLKPEEARKAYEDVVRADRPEAAVARVLALERLGDLDRAAGANGAGVARYREALAALPAARKQAKTPDDRRNLLGGELAARTGLAYAAAAGRDRAGIEEQVAPARAIAAELSPFQAASTDFDLGLAFANAQAIDRARTLFEAALPPALERTSTMVPASRLEKGLGDLDLLLRRTDAAQRHYRAALLLVRDAGPPDVALDAVVGLALVESQIDRPAAT
jgi:HEAT repeat protein